MAKKSKDQRSHLGYGSSYKKGTAHDLSAGDDIGAVLGGQVWKIKPDEKAKAANPCLWMQAGVVNFKSCNNFYDCTACKYDLGMKMQVEKGKQSSWQNSMRRRPPLERICRHSLTNRIPHRLCAYDFQCATCDFDQLFEDVLATKTKTFPSEMMQVKGFDLPLDYLFHNGHTWARIESGGYIRIGLDDFALKLLGKADALDLPLMGKELDQGAVGWGLKRKNNVADVLSPVGGVIVEVNSKVRENPGLANNEPYGDGWLFMVRNPNIKKSVQSLMAETDSLDWMNQEVDTLEKMIEDVAGPLAADGGYFQADIIENVPQLGWNNLTKTFLRT
jgi:glycine cleavage system H lipoate-binding protein